ncbi:gastrula zinc finger protein xFG20-1-like [Anopheles funestus]|uniref:gastrula zinc finger protein xFG20-1-like n=1 Tax=Anopheles funestus TaxID=62324 RepID=UPI0020C67E22|nr:gastrula zinc finger protein xFG20-1-like [Anopheles funestus]
MVKEIPSSTVVNRDEECLKKSLMEVVKSDSSNLCRLCLSKEQKLTRAFSDERGIDDALLKKIFDCTTVKVKLKNIFPSAICAVCDLKLNEFYKFREKCIENDTFLHNLLDDRVTVAEVDQSVPIVDEQQSNSRTPTKSSGSAAEQQAATSTTSIPEAQKHTSSSSEMMAIALNQLSSFGLRPLQELMLETNGSLEAAGALLPNSGGNVVSSSSAPSQPHDAPAPSLISSIEYVSQKARQLEQERTFALATLEMAGLQAMRNHSTVEGGGKFKCTVCHRTFRNAYTLRRHTNLHTETNLFPCEYCGKKFNDRSNWKIHQRTHTGDNLYTCLVCLKTFISPSTLKYHRRSHRRLESFDCRLCSGTFSSYDLLEEHARTMHQDMQDLQSDEPMIDAASFVKIELEDGELSSSTTRLQRNTDDDPRERRSIDSSSVDDAQLAELYRTQQMLELFEKQFQTAVATTETDLVEGEQPPGNETTLEEKKDQEAAAIMREMRAQIQQQQQNEVEVKEEPLDESLELDPSELLQQAMEETADGNDDGGGKQFSSSSSASSSPSAVILFRCDYCMKIFHFLDELNAHMLLHNGAAGKAGQGGAVMLGSATASSTPTAGTVPNTSTTPRPDSMPMLALMGPDGPISLVSSDGAKEPKPRKPKRRRTGFVGPEQGKSAKNAENGGEPVAPASPPEYPCSKCTKMFRTEELKRVHEATHADDEQANKVRSCRICNKLFKCELNLLAHMRKHSLTVLQGAPAEGEPAGDSSGNDESCSSSSQNGGISATTLQEPAHHDVGPADDSDEGETIAQTSDVASSESGAEAGGSGDSAASLAANFLSRGAFRKCEICAITFKDSVTLDKHMLCHFERKEAIAFVPQTDRPFQCTECHKSFKRKDYLLIHIRTHTGERRYKCDLCSSAFVHPSNLITHRKLHSSERPYQCTLCGATFKLFAGLKIHRRRCEQKLPKSWTDGVPPPGFSTGPHELSDTAEQVPTDNVHYPF